MKKAIYGSVAIAALSVSAFALLGGANSGLKPGENVTPFHPKHITGPLAGSDKCFPCTYQQRPQVQVWVNGDDLTNVTAIAKNLQKNIVSHKGSEFKAMVVFVSNDAAKLAPALKEAAKNGAPDVAMSVISPKDEAVEAYKINLSPEVKNTVIVYKNWKVDQTMVNFKATDKGLEALNGAIAKIAK
jgi:hypothetical protein